MSTETAAYPLTLDAIVQRYPGAPAPAVDNVTLEIGAGELVALLGPSGCGKTTLLRIIAGFIEQTEGKVVVGDKRIDELPPNRREVGIVFQNYALFPHMTVADNVAYGLAARGEPQAAQRERVGRDAGAGADGALGRPAIRASCPAASSSAWRWRARWPSAAHAAARRAVRGARQEPAAGHADRDQAHPAPCRHHPHHGHARPGRGDDAWPTAWRC